ncbi:MAG: hypothetical protein ACI4E1_02155 [Lachnospira sp.]
MRKKLPIIVLTLILIMMMSGLSDEIILTIRENGCCNYSESNNKAGDSDLQNEKSEYMQSEYTYSKLLKTAVMPVGKTMYIWGGGWNVSDDGMDKDGLIQGLSPEWKQFAEKQTADYDMTQYLYQREKGLDCSGYIGWLLYNVFGNEYSETGYVCKSSTMTSRLSALGMGIENLNYEIKDFRPGDIMSMSGHVWMVLGECSDGSVVLIHSSPPGVRIAGTLLKNGDSSMAVELAEKYMKKYYPDWYEKYPGCTAESNYITDVIQFRFTALKDDEGIRRMDAREVLKFIYDE